MNDFNQPILSFCVKCGTKLSAGEVICPNCGEDFSVRYTQRNMERNPQITVSQRNYIEGYHNRENGYRPLQEEYISSGQSSFIQPSPSIAGYDPSKDYTPIGMWGYFGYNILFLIPIIGVIIALVFALGGTRNINLRNYARSQFCILLLIFLGIIILGGVGAAAKLFTFGM